MNDRVGRRRKQIVISVGNGIFLITTASEHSDMLDALGLSIETRNVTCYVARLIGGGTQKWSDGI